MDTLIIVQKSYVEIAYNAEYNRLVVVFRDDIPTENYKEIWNEILAQIKERKISNVFVDQRSIGKVSLDARAWVVVKWLPLIKKEVVWDLKVGALMAKSIVMKLGGQYLMNAAKSENFNVKTFTNEDELLAWLS